MIDDHPTIYEQLRQSDNEIAQLRERIAELEAEVARLKAVVERMATHGVEIRDMALDYFRAATPARLRLTPMRERIAELEAEVAVLQEREAAREDK